METTNKDLHDIREDIRTLDEEFLKIIAARRKLSHQVAVSKSSTGKNIRDTEVEHLRLGELVSKGKAMGLDAQSVSNLYQTILEDSVLTQHATLQATENPDEVIEQPKVALLGGEGSYSQLAAHKHFGHHVGNGGHAIHEIPCDSFEKIIRKVETGEADHGLLPVMNTLTGSIPEAYNRLRTLTLSVTGEVILPVEHCLLAKNEGFPLKDIRTVYAHPQAIAQCASYLKQLGGATLVNCTSTTEALTRVCEGKANEVAIGGAVAGQTFGLRVLGFNIQGSRQNYTRFLVLSGEAKRVSRQVPAKTTIAVIPQQSAGGLADVLMVLKEHGINIRQMDSRPSQGATWELMFFLDLEMNVRDEIAPRVLEGLEKKATFVKVLGCYASAEINPFQDP